MNLKNNCVLITGGSSGIGLAFAKKFLSMGNRVLICGRNVDKLKRAQESNPGLETFRCDMTDLNNMKQLLEYIKANFSQINTLINNAGIQHNYRFDDGQSHLDKIDEEISINLSAQLRLTDLLLPLLLKTHSAIINISSALSIVPKESAPVYCATKAGIHIFSRALRYQLENTSVKVFEVVPALVETDMTHGRGSNKISPADLVNEAIKGFARDQYLIKIGKTKILFAICRLFPSLADKIIRRG